MKRFINIAGPLYVCFAILAAYTAVASVEKTVAYSADNQAQVEPSDRVLCDRQRVDFTNTTRVIADKRNYTIEVWTAEGCFACNVWKRRELPALLKAGFTVDVKDPKIDIPPEEITSVPTVCLYYKGELIAVEVNWKAKDIIKFIEGRISLKM